jgi:hypothetical protein
MLCLLTPFRFQTARFAVARVCTQQALPPSPPATHPSRWRLPRPPPPMHALCSWPCVWPPTPCLCPPSAARGRATLGAAVSVRPRQHTCSCLPAGRVLARARASHVCCHEPPQAMAPATSSAATATTAATSSARTHPVTRQHGSSALALSEVGVGGPAGTGPACCRCLSLTCV